MRHVPHPHAVSRDTAIPPDGGGRPAAASRLEPVRYGARGLPPSPHVAGRAGGGLLLDLPAPVLPCLHLAPPARGLARGRSLSRDVVSLQAVELFVASVDSSST